MYSAADPESSSSAAAPDICSWAVTGACGARAAGAGAGQVCSNLVWSAAVLASSSAGKHPSALTEMWGALLYSNLSGCTQLAMQTTQKVSVQV